MHKAIIVDYKKCTGCRICEEYCSLYHEGIVNPRLSRIRVFSYLPGIDIPVVCIQCEKAPCIDACPQKIINRNEIGAVVITDINKCTRCMACANACPMRAIFTHLKTGLPIKCDLCGGKPVCIEVCPTGALEYELTPFDARHIGKPDQIASELKSLMLYYEVK